MKNSKVNMLAAGHLYKIYHTETLYTWSPYIHNLKKYTMGGGGSSDEAEPEISRTQRTCEDISFDLAQPAEQLKQSRRDALLLLQREQRLTERTRKKLDTPLNPFIARAQGGQPKQPFEQPVDLESTTGKADTLTASKGGSVFPVADKYVEDTFSGKDLRFLEGEQGPNEDISAEDFTKDFAIPEIDNSSLWQTVRKWFLTQYSNGGGEALIHPRSEQRYTFKRTSGVFGSYDFNAKEAVRVYNSGVVDPPKRAVNNPRSSVFNGNSEVVDSPTTSKKRGNTDSGGGGGGGALSGRLGSLSKALGNNGFFSNGIVQSNKKAKKGDGDDLGRSGVVPGVTQSDLLAATKKFDDLSASIPKQTKVVTSKPTTDDNLTETGSVNVKGLRNYYDPVGSNQRVLKQLEYKAPTRLFAGQF